jgi:capsular polysaccharide biosynthesis protein/Mrp family chromosome partitioning ATPase
MELRDYLPILYRRIWLVVLGTLTAMLSSYLVFRYSTPWPPYEATATVIIGDDALGLDTVQAIRATYAELAGRRPVSQAVVDTLALPMSADDLEELVRVNPVGYTRLLEISVTYNDAQQAATVANEVARQIGQVTLSTQTTLIQTIAEAQVPTRPSLGPYIGIFVAGVTGFSLTAGFMVLIEYLSGKIRAPQDVEQSLRLPVLGIAKRTGDTRRDALFGLLRRHRGKKMSETSEEKTQEVSMTSPASLSETYQWICFRLSHLEEGAPQELLITSPDVLKGQSILSAGLATAWAETGQKIVLINAHLRHTVTSQWSDFSDNGSSSASHERVEYQHVQESETVALMEGAKSTASPKPLEDVEPHVQNERRVPSAHRSLLERIAEMGPPLLARRARLILAWDDGFDVRELQERAGYSQSRVYHWLRAYRLYGLQIFSEQVDIDPSELPLTRVDSERTVSRQKPNQPMLSALKQQYDALDDDVLDDFSREADVVIVNGPPILATPNAAILASKVDGVLLVLDVGKTRINAAREALKIVEMAGGRVLGAILLS